MTITPDRAGLREAVAKAVADARFRGRGGAVTEEDYQARFVDAICDALAATGDSEGPRREENRALRAHLADVHHCADLDDIPAATGGSEGTGLDVERLRDDLIDLPFARTTVQREIAVDSLLARYGLAARLRDHRAGT